MHKIKGFLLNAKHWNFYCILTEDGDRVTEECIVYKVF